jgi:hypothetical protein
LCVTLLEHHAFVACDFIAQAVVVFFGAIVAFGFDCIWLRRAADS